MLNDTKIANELNCILNAAERDRVGIEVSEDMQKEALASAFALGCSMLQAIHSIARSLDVIAEHMTHPKQVSIAECKPDFSRFVEIVKTEAGK